MKPLDRLTYISSVVAVISALCSGIVFLWAGSSSLAPSKRVVIDKNKVQLQIDRVENKKFVSSDEEYLTVIVKNVAPVSARNVRMRILGSDGEIFADRDDIQKMWMIDKRRIDSGEKAYFPVVKLSELKEYISKLESFERIEAYSIDSVRPDLMAARQKECFDKGLSSCMFDTLNFPLGVEIKYESIFDEKGTIPTFINVILLKNSIKS